MNCLQAEEYFSARLEDILDYQTLQDFEGHLTACETCQHEYARFQKSVKVVQQLPQIELSPHFMSALRQRLIAEKQRLTADQKQLDVQQDDTRSVTEIAATGWKQLLDIFRRPKWAFSGIIALILAAAGTYFYQDLRPASVVPTPQVEQIATSPDEFPAGQPRFRRSGGQFLRSGVISVPVQPMQQHYMLKQVSYTTTSTSGGL